MIINQKLNKHFIVQNAMNAKILHFHITKN